MVGAQQKAYQIGDDGGRVFCVIDDAQPHNDAHAKYAWRKLQILQRLI